MKVSIFAFAVNDKFPIDIANKQFKKHVKDEFEYIIFNDAEDSVTEEKINEVCALNSIKCVKVPQEIHSIHNPNDGYDEFKLWKQNPSEAYVNTLHWALYEYASNNDCETIVLMHTDIFPIKDLSFETILDGKAVASTIECKIINGKAVIYFYPALVIINTKFIRDIREINFDLAPGLDCGGKTREFIQNNPDIIKFIYHQPLLDFISESLRNDSLQLYFKLVLALSGDYILHPGWVADGLYHYVAGSQWNSSGLKNVGHQKKMDLLHKQFNT